MKLRRSRNRGFTLLELLVVIAILATIAGGILVSYDGLEADAAEGQATFNMAAIDKSVRTYKVLNKKFPDNLDSLMVADGSAFCVMLPRKLQGTDGVATTDAVSGDDGKLAFYTLTARGASALQAAGITKLRSIATGSNAETIIPNRVFDDPSRGNGTEVAVAAGAAVTIIETDGLGAGDSTRLRDMAGLDATKRHIVVAFGLGNNASICSADGGAGTLSEAPWYTKSAKNEYGRFLLLFHLATDVNDDGTVADAEFFSQARFVGVLDTFGDWLDEEYAEFTNQKQ